MSRAIFLGSFNPPHRGHLNCLETVINSGVMEEFNIEYIHVIPAYQNPNKKDKAVSFYTRCQMCSWMFSRQNGHILIDDIEGIVKPKYTYELLQYLNDNDRVLKGGFWWIVTIETLRELLDGKWKNSEELLYDNNFIVLYESEGEKLALYEDYNLKFLCAKYIKINNPINYHSTQIRELAKKGKSTIEFTNRFVDDIIKEENLYKNE